MKFKLAILFISIGFLSAIAFSQIRTLNQADFWKASSDANEVSERVVPRSTTAEEKYFNSGKLLSSILSTTDYDAEGNEHLIEVSKSGNKSATRELIRIGKVYYCRNDKRAWKKWEGFCGS